MRKAFSFSLQLSLFAQPIKSVGEEAQWRCAVSDINFEQEDIEKRK
jgi:hypothetical protein